MPSTIIGAGMPVTSRIVGTMSITWRNLRKAASQELQSLPDRTGMGRNYCSRSESAAIDLPGFNY
jgi:hypothetical protein